MLDPFITKPRFLIARLSAIGDVAHSLPLLEELKEHFPSAPIAWVAEPGPSQILKHHPHIERLIVVDKNWRKSLRKILMLRRELRQFAPSVSIDPQGLSKSSFVGWLSGARLRIGYAGENGRGLSKLLNNCLHHPTSSHIVDCNLELLKPLGIEPKIARFHIAEQPEESHAIEQLLERAGMKTPFAVMNVGAGWKSKLWRADRFAHVASYIFEKYSISSLVLWSSDSEKLAAEEICRLSTHAIMAPHTSLREVASLARRCCVFIASDTGPLHIAVAVGAKCIGLFGPMPASRNGPYGEHNIAIQKAQFNGPRSERRRAPSEIMDSITAKDVCDACDTILGCM